MQAADVYSRLGPTYDDTQLLAVNYLQLGLTDSDRDTLRRVSRRYQIQSTVGQYLGFALGAFIAFRLRRSRRQRFAAFRNYEKPKHLAFADGRIGESVLAG